jgi:hypothetical protein
MKEYLPFNQKKWDLVSDERAMQSDKYFKYTNARPKNVKAYGDCQTRAVSFATGRNYYTTRQWFYNYYKEHPNKDLSAFADDTLEAYCKFYKIPIDKSLKGKLIKDVLDTKGTYLLQVWHKYPTEKHVTVLKNGKIYDLYNDWMNLKITRAYKVK